MKILYPIIDGEISGGNIICLRIIEESLKRGYGVIVNSPTQGRFTSLLREKGIRVYNIDTRRTFRLNSVLKLAGIIKKEDVGIIHSHTLLGGAILSRLAGFITGTRVINHAHAVDFINRNLCVGAFQILLNWITSRLFCDKVIAVSEYVKKEIVKQGVVHNKISVIYNGIDLENVKNVNNSARIRNEFNLKEGYFVVGEVARLCEDKGQRIFIEAAHKVKSRFRNVIFMIVGEDLLNKGGYQKKLEGLTADLQVAQNFIFTGYRSDIADLMEIFDLFVLPSNRESLPVTVLEAMAAKKAVITTAVGGNLEIVLDNQTGTLISANNPDELAEAIIYHLTNPDISKRMGEEGYKIVRQFFSLSRMLNGVMGAYKEVLKENNG